MTREMTRACDGCSFAVGKDEPFCEASDEECRAARAIAIKTCPPRIRYIQHLGHKPDLGNLVALDGVMRKYRQPSKAIRGIHRTTWMRVEVPRQVGIVVGLRVVFDGDYTWQYEDSRVFEQESGQGYYLVATGIRKAHILVHPNDLLIVTDYDRDALKKLSRERK